MKKLTPGTDPPWVVAHRGASAERPENSVAAFDLALEQGADAIELDAQISQDGIPLVYHDRLLSKAGGGRKRISDQPAAETRKLEVGSWFDERFRGEPLLALQQVLRRYGPLTRLLIELKSRRIERQRGLHLTLAERVARMIRANRMHSKCMVLSFHAEAFEAIHGQFPGVRTVLNLKPPKRISGALRKTLDGVFAVSADVTTLTPAFGEAVREMRKPLLAFTCNTEETVRRALDVGSDAIMSDRPAWARETIRQMQPIG